MDRFLAGVQALIDFASPRWKAIVGFVAPGAVLIGSSVTEASACGEAITQGEWITAGVACVVTAAAVYRVPNQDAKGERQDESVQPPGEPPQ